MDPDVPPKKLNGAYNEIIYLTNFKIYFFIFAPDPSASPL